MSDVPTAMPTSAPEAPRLSEAQRLGNAFAAPSATFADVQHNRSWWAPLVVMAIMSVIFIVAVEKKVGWTQVATNMMSADPKQSERFEQMPADQRAGAYTMVGNFMRYTSYASPVLSVLFVAIVAGILLGIFNFGMGVKHSYKYAFAASMYAFMPPGVIRGLIGAITLFAGADPEGFMLDNPVASNLGVLVDRAESPALYVLLSSIDVFTIWLIILLGIAFAAGTKLKRGTAISAVAGAYAVIVLLRTAWAALL